MPAALPCSQGWAALLRPTASHLRSIIFSNIEWKVPSLSLQIFMQFREFILLGCDYSLLTLFLGQPLFCRGDSRAVTGMLIAFATREERGKALALCTQHCDKRGRTDILILMHIASMQNVGQRKCSYRSQKSLSFTLLINCFGCSPFVSDWPSR